MHQRIYQLKSRIVDNLRIRGDYCKIILDAPEIARNFLPGQFVHIRVAEQTLPLLRRPFSIHRTCVSSSKTKKYIEIFYKVVGMGTSILVHKKIGESLDILGPLGNGFKIGSLKPHIVVAGGMGVAPLFALSQSIIKTKYPKSSIYNEAGKIKQRPLVLIGARTKKQIFCVQELRKLGCNVKVATDDGSSGFKGKVTELLEKILATDHRSQTTGQEPEECNLKRAAIIYACGPRAMLKEIVTLSKIYNISAQLCFEEMMGCGIGACLGCVIRTNSGYKRVCRDGPVFFADNFFRSMV